MRKTGGEVTRKNQKTDEPRIARLGTTEQPENWNGLDLTAIGRESVLRVSRSHDTKEKRERKIAAPRCPKLPGTAQRTLPAGFRTLKLKA